MREREIPNERERERDSNLERGSQCGRERENK